MKLDNPDFIIKEGVCIDDEKEYILRRYKGKGGIVEIPEGVTQIEDNIFGDDIEPNKTVTKIILPDTVKDIEIDAFSYCESLTELSLSKNIKSLYLDLKGCTSIKKLVIPDSITEINCIVREKNLKDISIGSNLIEVSDDAFHFYSDEEDDNQEDDEVFNTYIKEKRKATITVLSQNPVYKIIDGFMVNTKTKTALFRVDFSNSEMKIPDLVETIGTHCLTEGSLFCTNDIHLEKLIIPSNVKTINVWAFETCNELQTVIYEGLSSDLKISDEAFDNCAFFRKDGRDIICKDTKEKKQPDRRLTRTMLRRIQLVHTIIKSGKHPNTDDILTYCQQKLGFDEPGLTKTTITRTLDILRDDFGAKIIYDHKKNGFEYDPKDFELDFEKIFLS